MNKQSVSRTAHPPIIVPLIYNDNKTTCIALSWSLRLNKGRGKITSLSQNFLEPFLSNNGDWEDDYLVHN